MSYRRQNVEFRCQMDGVRLKVEAALRCVNVLCPSLDARGKKRMVDAILTLTDRRDRTPSPKTISPAGAVELV